MAVCGLKPFKRAAFFLLVASSLFKASFFTRLTASRSLLAFKIKKRVEYWLEYMNSGRYIVQKIVFKKYDRYGQ
jgi:hypothetical protein